MTPRKMILTLICVYALFIRVDIVHGRESATDRVGETRRVCVNDADAVMGDFGANKNTFEPKPVATDLTRPNTELSATDSPDYRVWAYRINERAQQQFNAIPDCFKNDLSGMVEITYSVTRSRKVLDPKITWAQRI